MAVFMWEMCDKWSRSRWYHLKGKLKTWQTNQLKQW